MLMVISINAKSVPDFLVRPLAKFTVDVQQFKYFFTLSLGYCSI